MATETAQRPGFLSVKQEESLLLTPEEQSSLAPAPAKAEPTQEPQEKEPEAKPQEAPKEEAKEAPKETPEAPEAPQAEKKEAPAQAEFDLEKLKQFAESKGFKDHAAFIKSFENAQAMKDRNFGKAKELEQRIEELQSRIEAQVQPQAQTAPVDAEQIQEAYDKAMQENPLETQKLIARFMAQQEIQNQVMPFIQQMQAEKHRELSKVAVSEASRRFKLFDQVRDKVGEILEEDHKFAAMRGAAKSLDDMLDMLELAYYKAVKTMGLQEPQTTRVTVPETPTRPPQVETPAAADLSQRRPAPQKSIEQNIADDIVLAAKNDPLRKFLGGK